MEKIQGYQFAIDLDDGGMARSLKTLRDEAKLLKSAMQSNFTEVKSGEGVMAAYAQKVKDAGKAIDAQNLVIDKLREKQNGLDQSTEKGRQSYIKYENQIESAKRSISNLQAQQERATKSLDLQRSGVLKLKEATELEERSVKSNVSVLEAQGRNYEAQKVKLTGLVSVHERMKAQLTAEKARMSELSSKYGAASTDAREQSIRVSDLTAKYKLNESAIKKVNHSVGGISTAGAKARDSVSLASTKMKSSLSSIKSGAVVAAGSVALIGAAALSGAKKASTLQNSYTQTNNLLVTGGEKAAEATKNVSKMQADGEKYSIKYGKSQKSIADQYQELVKRGYTSKEALGAMRSELQASVASGDDFSDVVKVASQTVDAFGMRTNNTAKMTKNTKSVVNELAYSADMTATSFSDLGKGMEYVGDSSHSAGIKLSTTSAALGILSNHGLEADKAGTGLRKVINSLTTSVKSIDSKSNMLNKLGIKKSDIEDANGNLKDLSTVMGVVNSKTKDLGTGEKNAVFQSLFGTTGQQAGLILAQNNDELDKLADKVQKAGDKGSYVQQLADKNSQTAQMSEKRFKQAWSDLTIMFGSKLLPYMTDAADRLTKLFGEKGFRKDIEATAEKAGKVAGNIEKIGVFAATHYKDIERIGIALGAIWAINKMAKFKSSLVELGAIQSRETKRIAAETELVGTQTAAYEANAKAKMAASEVGGTGTNVTSTAGKVESTATEVSSTAVNGAGLAGDAEKAVTKSGSKWNLLGKSLGGRLINGAGLALTAWDAGSSIAKAIGSGKAQDKYKAVGKTAGTVIGGAIGAIGGPTGVMIGASIGDQLGSTKTAQNIAKGLAKAFKQAKIPKIKVEAESSKKAYAQLTAEAKKYYSAKQKQDKADIALLYKNGDLTKAEYQKRLKAIGDEGKQASKLEKLSQADRNAITKYYAQSRAKLETTWNKKIAADKKKWDNQILKDTAKYGANSEKVQKDQAKKAAAIKTDENKKSKALDQQKLKFSTQTTVKEAKLYTTLNGKVQQASNKQEAIIKKLNADKGKLSNKQLQTAVNTAEKEYKQTVNLANQEYNKRVSAANNTHDKVVKAAERQLGDVRNAANKQYKDTVSAANNQYKGNSKWAEQQRADVKKKAEQQRDSTIKSAEEQANKIEQHAEDQRKQVVDKAEKQRSNAVDKSKRQRDDVNAAAESQSKGVVKHATNQANSSMEANKKQGEGTHSIWKSIASFFNGLTKPFGVKAIDAGSSSFAYTRATSGAYATGGGITKASRALVGEAGVELKYQPWSGTVDLIGAHGPEFIDVRPGDQILNAQDTQKVLAGNYGRNLPGYAKGTTGIAEFLSKIKSGASDVFDDVSDAASDALSKITNPKKTLEDLAAKTFNINSISGVGSMQRGASKGMVDKSIDGIANALSKLVKASGDFGSASNPSGSGVSRWKSTIKKAAAKMKVNLTSAGMAAILKRITQESNGSATIQNNTDSNAAKGTPSKGLLQYIQPTLSAWVPKGVKAVLKSGYTQLLAMFNDSNWLADISVSGGWGPTGHKRMANGGIVGQHQMVEMAEGNMPEAVVPLDLSKRSRAYQVMQQSLDYFKGQDGANNVVTSSSDGSTKQLQAVIAGLTSLNNSLSQLLGVNVAQVKAIQQSAFSKDQLYRQQARDQGYKTSQSLR
ncbi:phage tail tape measure protein [Loigolactobacillus jiayinensis]|uniref:Phage tail tape measure protein n=1 Tax=Loigolactobacillus jiayinensis TaxID=2486016 RepID=A0ABW1RBV0_9LACO|nr:phage tail tape measure protein [Loigolactobacillus jiayinensis]